MAVGSQVDHENIFKFCKYFFSIFLNECNEIEDLHKIGKLFQILGPAILIDC